MTRELEDAVTERPQPAVPRRPRLLVISFSPLARDPRVLRQIRLLSGTYDVETCGYGALTEPGVRHTEIPMAIQGWRPNYRRFAALLALRRFRRAYFRSPIIGFVRAAFADRTFDVIVANDESAVPIALELGPRGGVHADLHEFSPRQRENDRIWKLLNAPFNDWMIRRFATRCRSVTTVSRGLADEYRRVYGIPAEVVPNAAPFHPEIDVRPTATPIRIVHTGAAGRGRRLEVMIEAVAAANRERPGHAVLDLYLVAGDATYIEELRRLALREGGGAIALREPVPFEDIVGSLATYDVGLFQCPPTTFNLRYALPNKLFEFVQARLGIVIGPSVEMLPYVRDRGLGVVADDFGVTATTRAVLSLRPETVDAFKRAAAAAARELGAEALSAPWLAAIAAASRESSPGVQKSSKDD